MSLTRSRKSRKSFHPKFPEQPHARSGFRNSKPPSVNVNNHVHNNFNFFGASPMYPPNAMYYPQYGGHFMVPNQQMFFPQAGMGHGGFRGNGGPGLGYGNPGHVQGFRGGHGGRGQYNRNGHFDQS